MATEIKLPPPKENVEAVEVNAVKVAPGDTVTEGQVLLEVQADKAALDITAPQAGKVAEVRVKVGDQVKVGQVYLTLEASGDGAKKAPAPANDKPKEAAPAPQPARQEAPRPAEPPPSRLPASQPAPVAATATANDKLVAAGPATRKLARELGVDLRLVPGTARNGRITEDDVKAYVKRLARGEVAPPVTTAPGLAVPSLPRFEEFGTIERQPLSAVRRATARQMSLAWSQVPHVTQHDLSDVTELEAFRKEQAAKGVKLTVTAFVLKACAVALKKFPELNSSLDLGNSQLVVKKYVHIGVAVDTPNGLLVPVLRDVDKKGVQALADELTAAAQRARDRKVDGGELKGGTFTITNLGGIGGTGFTPIVNWPEVAILGLSRSRTEPVYRDGQFVPRLMLPLSLSYDHRVIDGAAAARFTRFVAEMLEQPLLMLLHA
jgi:pyruvate dehydrogenase E2 component (dihydrolipoamide acetyltransferase)